MPLDNSVSENYLHGDLLNAIENALPGLGRTTDSVTIEDLGPVDEFHIGGRIATDHLLDQLNFPENAHLLDVGCGLGGASRFVADKFNHTVIGIDLAQEYIDTGNTLSSWVKLHQRISLHQGSALEMPFKDQEFDGGFMLHVGMNIKDKSQLFQEIFRVMRPGSSFGVYDIMGNNAGELVYPLPWAASPELNHLASTDEYQEAMNAAGFEIISTTSRRDFALEFFRQLSEKLAANGGPPPLGLHILMGDSTSVKLKNLVDCIAADLCAPVEMIAIKNS